MRSARLARRARKPSVSTTTFDTHSHNGTRNTTVARETSLSIIICALMTVRAQTKDHTADRSHTKHGSDQRMAVWWQRSVEKLAGCTQALPQIQHKVSIVGTLLPASGTTKRGRTWRRTGDTNQAGLDKQSGSKSGRTATRNDVRLTQSARLAAARTGHDTLCHQGAIQDQRMMQEASGPSHACHCSGYVPCCPLSSLR